MTAIELPVGLKVQEEGDADWDDALNNGFVLADQRLRLQGTTDPNGTVAGHWVGQNYIQLRGTAPGRVGALWICTTATGVAGTTVWRRAGVHIGSALDRPVWTDLLGNSTYFSGGCLSSTVEENVSVYNAPASYSPQVELLMPATLDLNEFAFFLSAMIQLNAPKTLNFQRKIHDGAWENISPPWSFGAGPNTMLYRDASPPVVAGAYIYYRVGTSEVGGLNKMILNVLACSRRGL